MPELLRQLTLERCPHCQVDKPSLVRNHSLKTQDAVGGASRFWAVYICGRCGGLVTAWARKDSGLVEAIYPVTPEVHEAVPSPAKEYLQQALQSQHAPDGAVILSASSVDAMLKAKGYKEGTLYARIKQASEKHLITAEMEEWAHEVRLEANNPRHADEINPLATADDARRSIEFTNALALFLFVLPDLVKSGRSKQADNNTADDDHRPGRLPMTDTYDLR